eukprot:8567539-Pyramimonas_sp.AAC.1
MNTSAEIVPRTLVPTARDQLLIPGLSSSDQQLAFLNVICHGTNFQTVEMYDGAALGAWRALMRCWIRPFGVPLFAITDGGLEFKGEFERGIEHLGVFQRVTDSESPWQNGRAERHGGW